MKRYIYATQPGPLARAIKILTAAVEGLAGEEGVGTVTHDTSNHQIVINWKDKSPSLVYTEAQLKDPNVSMGIISDVNKIVREKEK